MKLKNKLVLNRIMKPGIPVSEFMSFAAENGVFAIELRNDLNEHSITGNETPSDLQEVMRRTKVEVLTINALQRFNDPGLFSQKVDELKALADAAKSVGCNVIVCCPVCDPADDRSSVQQEKDLAAALQVYAPLCTEMEITCLIEPLGFPISSLRFKESAVRAIQAGGYETEFGIVHDTFHHFLAGEMKVFPQYTGLLHISGVPSGKALADITDEDRVFINKEDIMDNKGQIEQLVLSGYTGPISFETFSSSVQKLSIPELEIGIKESLSYLFE